MEAIAHTPRVWIANWAGHDYHAAKRYGEFHFITKGYVSFQSLDRVVYTVAEQVAQTHEEDWLLISGRPIISCIAAMLWLAKHGKVKILCWDQKAKGKDAYRELIVTRDNALEILQSFR